VVPVALTVLGEETSDESTGGRAVRKAVLRAGRGHRVTGPQRSTTTRRLVTTELFPSLRDVRTFPLRGDDFGEEFPLECLGEAGDLSACAWAGPSPESGCRMESSSVRLQAVIRPSSLWRAASRAH
jgi:hypothetical protein